MTLGWPCPILERSHFCNLGLSIGKCGNSGFFSETVAACDMKVGRHKQLIELIKVCEYSRSMSFLDLGPRSFTYENKPAFLRNHWAIFNQNLYVSY